MRRGTSHITDRELANRLFALTTAKLEDAIEHAVAGQSSTLAAARLNAEATCLWEAVKEVVILTEAAMIAVDSSLPHTLKRSARHPRKKHSTSP